MARKRQDGELKWRIVERNGEKYVYTSTSHMENGRKVNDETYLGKLDADGNLIPKKPYRSREERERIREEMSIDPLDGLRVKEYGAVHFLDCIQRRMGLGEDLIRSFGLSGTTILAMAEAMAIGDTEVFLDIDSIFERTSLRDYYGLTSPMDSHALTIFTNDIGKATPNVDEFYQRRVQRAMGAIAWDLTTQGTYSDMQGLSEYLAKNEDNEDLKQVKTGIATDQRGIPMMLRHYPGTLSEQATLLSFMDDLKRYGKDPRECTLAYDRGFEVARNAKCSLEQGFRFVAPVAIGPRPIKRLLTEFVSSKEKTAMVYDDHAYTVMTAKVGLRASDKPAADGSPNYEFTLEGDEGHGSEGMLDAYICFDSEKYSNEIQARDRAMDAIMKKAAKIDCAHPVKEFNRIAGKMASKFSVRADGRKVIVSVKNNSMTFSENRAGMFIMLCTEGIGWDIMMKVYDIRCYVEQAFDKKKSADRRFRTNDKISMEGREFVRFLALMLRAEIEAEFRENKLDTKYTVEGTLSNLNSMVFLIKGDWSRLDNVTKAHRTVFSSCGYDIPKSVVRGVTAYDYPTDDIPRT
jgi:hypothetical protein